MKICDDCQNQIVNFHLFQLKTRRAQESYKLGTETLHNDDSIEPLVMHTLDIVKSFIEKHPCSIAAENDERRLVIERIGGEAAPEETEVIKEETATKSMEPELFLMKEETVEEIVEDYKALEYDEVDDDDDSEGIEQEPDELEDVEMTEEDSTVVEKSMTDRFVLNNVEFVERTPEYLINAYKPSEKAGRPKDPDNWIRNRQRNARARGEKYTTVSGKVIAAKRMQSPCKESCRYKCRTKISEDDRQRNFDNYWQLASFILQRKFIFEHHKTSPIQRRRFRIEGGKPREYSSHYFLDKFTDEGVEQVQVCEKMFLKTFDICRNIVAYLHKKVQTGTVQDLRGINRRKLSAGHEAAIEQIKSNPFYHIENPMPIARLFDIYKQECVEKGIEAVKSHTYRKLFNEYSECEFLKRDKILCDICDRYNKASDEEKSFLVDKYSMHVKTNEKCMQRAKAKDRAAKKVVQRRDLKQQKIQAEQDARDDEIIEEHLTDELE